MQDKNPMVKLQKQPTGEMWRVDVDGFFAGTIFQQRHKGFRASSNLMLRETERYVQEDIEDKQTAKDLLVKWFQRERSKINGGQGV
jgi:CubicO group peptidase (beta-lactamase class C family)